jgi:hypothetical protein
MPQITRCIVAALILAAAACVGGPTQPIRQPALAGAAPANTDEILPGPDGTCRSGYTVANGLCVPI